MGEKRKHLRTRKTMVNFGRDHGLRFLNPGRYRIKDASKDPPAYVGSFVLNNDHTGHNLVIEED